MMTEHVFIAKTAGYCGSMNADGEILFSHNHHPDYTPFDFAEGEQIEVGTMLYNYLVDELIGNSAEAEAELKENDLHPIHFFEVKDE